MKLVIIGGHLSPALAVIDSLPKNAEVLFIGRKYTFEGDKGHSLEYNTIKSLKIPFASISTGRLQRKFTKHTIFSFLKIPYGFIQAFFILRSFKPDVVLGFGGYLSLPVILSAFVLKIPVVIHEQTLEAGLANRIASYFATKVCIAWESSRKFFPEEKTILTGNPIRKFKFLHSLFTKCHAEFISASRETLKQVQGDKKKNMPIVYITGGSSGSHFINTLIQHCIKELLCQFIIIHQTGDSQQYRDFDRLKKLREGLSSKIKSRYILKKFIAPCDIGLVLQNADLVIGRSGINTVTELIYFQKIAILIPLPYSQNKEQKKNALFFKGLGLGEVLNQESLDLPQFLQKVIEMVNNINKYKIGYKANNLINKNAAKNIIEIIEYVKKSKKD